MDFEKASMIRAVTAMIAVAAAFEISAVAHSNDTTERTLAMEKRYVQVPYEKREGDRVTTELRWGADRIGQGEGGSEMSDVAHHHHTAILHNMRIGWWLLGPASDEPQCNGDSEERSAVTFDALKRVKPERFGSVLCRPLRHTFDPLVVDEWLTKGTGGITRES